MALDLISAIRAIKKVVVETVDPTVTAVDAPAGTLLIKLSAPFALYQKQDNGASINWTIVGAGGGGGGGSIVSFPSSTIVAGDVGKLAMLVPEGPNIGEAAVYEPGAITFISAVKALLTSQPAPGDVYRWNDGDELGGVDVFKQEGVDFATGATIEDTAVNIAAAYNADAAFNVTNTATAIGKYIKFERNVANTSFKQLFANQNNPSFVYMAVSDEGVDTSAANFPWALPIGKITGVNGGNAEIDPSPILELTGNGDIIRGSKVFPGPAGTVQAATPDIVAVGLSQSVPIMLALSDALNLGDPVIVFNNYFYFRSREFNTIIGRE